MKKEVILAFIAGALCGGLIGFAAGWLIKEKEDDKFFDDLNKDLEKMQNELIEDAENARKREDSAVEAMSRYKGVVINPMNEEQKETIKDEMVKPQKMILTEEQADNIRRNHNISHFTDKLKKRLSNSEEPMGPVVISAEDYLDDEQSDGWDKMEYRYYPSADLLVDDVNDVRIMDYTYEIGSEALDIIRNAPEGEETMVFVRNPYLNCDFQITVDWDEPNAEFYDVPDLNDMDGGVKG